jgi:hypothetical protein
MDRAPLLLVLALLPPLQDGRSELRDAIRRYDRQAAHRTAAQLLEQGSRPAVEQLLSAVELAVNEEDSLSRSLQEARRTERRVYQEYRRPAEHVDRPRLLEELKTLERNILAFEERIATVRGLRERIAEGLAGLSDAKVAPLLLERVGSAGAWQVRWVCAQAAAGNPILSFDEVGPALLRQLEAEKHPAVRAQLLDALRVRRDKREVVVMDLQRRLQGEPWPVASAAVRFLQEIGAPESVPVLIDAMSGFEGRLRHELRDCLVALTGEGFAADPAAWRGWWERHGKEFAAGTYSPPSGRSVLPDAYSDLFGIPIRSTRVLFILDRSESMSERAAWKPAEEDPALAAELKLAGDAKLDAARFQIKKVLLRLPKGTRFNVISCGDGVRVFGELPASLTDDSRRQAFAHIDEITASGGTNLFSALEQARFFLLRAGGRAVPDAYDTVYLISDGLPSAGAVRDPKEILLHLASLVRLSRIRVHTVYTGGEGETGREFMRQAAAVGDGTFVEPGR